MNWGVKISLALGIFMLGIVLAGVYMVSKNTDTLEDDDYYERGIHYDEVYARKQNLQQHQAKPKVWISGNTLKIEFTQAGNAGTLSLRRSSDRAQDRRIPFEIDGKYMEWNLDSLPGGSWNLELEWKAGQISYQYEEKVYWTKP